MPALLALRSVLSGLISLFPLFALAACAPYAARPLAVSERPALAIVNVTVVDAETGLRTRGSTILVTGDTIAAVGSNVAIPAGAHRIDGSGKFAIPGLWDMHTHHQASGRESLELSS